MMLLRALAVGVDDSEELGCFTLGFNQEPDGSGPGLLLQRGYEFDEQDKELGFDTYCLVTDTQATAYGGIETWQLAEGWLRMTLSQKTAEDLGVDRDLLIQFAPIHQEMVRAGLARILAPVTEKTSSAKPAAKDPTAKKPAKKAAAKTSAKKAAAKKPSKKRTATKSAPASRRR